jgi:replicative DNA helicase
MRAMGTLENAGGAAYIAKLTDAVPSSANVEYYAKIVRNVRSAAT